MTLTAAQHSAMEGEAPFPLAEEVALPSGRKIAGTRARVYSLLRQTAERGERHRIGLAIGPAGWVPNYYLRKPWSGGNAGDRRLRDLREMFGVRIETCRFADDSAVVLYRWAGDPEPDRFPVSSAKTFPLARNGEMGGFSLGERGSGPTRDSEAPQRLRFWTSVGFPGGDSPARVAIDRDHEHPLALPAPIVPGLIRGAFDEAGALELYDQALRRRWPVLRSWMESAGERVLWLDAAVAETLNPLPLLVEILAKCGAVYLGDWNARDRQIGAA